MNVFKRTSERSSLILFIPSCVQTDNIILRLYASLAVQIYPLERNLVLCQFISCCQRNFSIHIWHLDQIQCLPGASNVVPLISTCIQPKCQMQSLINSLPTGCSQLQSVSGPKARYNSPCESQTCTGEYFNPYLTFWPDAIAM